MGYRSQVIITIAKEPLDKIRFIQAEALPAMLQEAFMNGEFATHERFYQFEWESIKWYDSYSEITEMNDYLDTFEEWDYKFHRLGENYGDYECRGDYDDQIYPTQHLETY